MSGYETTPADRARWRVHDKIYEVAVLLDGEQVRIERPSTFGPDHALERDVEALAGVRAALFVHRVAKGRVRHYAEQARGEGVSWARIGEALGLAEEAKRADTPLGEAAFSFVTEGRRPGQAPSSSPLAHPSRARWSCTSCGQRITDHGPFDGHPADCEQGHAHGCERHRAEIAAYQRGHGR